MKLLSKFGSHQRHFRRSILTATILPAALAASAFGVDWNVTQNVSTDAPNLDAIRVLGNTIVTLSGAGTTATENSISFEPSVLTETLTVNYTGPTLLTLRSNSTVLGIVSGTSATVQRATTINGTADFAPGALFTGPVGGPALTNVSLIKNGGTGMLILDDLTNTSNLVGTTLKVLDGTLSIVGGGGTLNPAASLTTQIEIGAAPNGLSPVLRIGSNSTDTTFVNSFRVINTGTLQHTSATTDTLAPLGNLPTLGITAGKTLTVNVAQGGLNVNGSVSDPDSDTLRGGTLKKTGVGTTLKLNGSTFISALNVMEGRVEVPATGRLRIFSTASAALAIGNGGTLSVLNTSTSLPNLLPTTILIPNGATLEGLPGSFVTTAGAQSALSLTGGTLNLGAGGTNAGLSAHLYNGTDVAPKAAFNTFANFSSYFAGLGSGLLTSTGANGYVDLSYGAAGTDTAMFQPIAPTYTATNNIISRFNGKIVINTLGNYTFRTGSDDGSMLYIDGQTVVSNNFSQGLTFRGGTVCLTPGLHDIEIGYYEGGGLNGLIVDYSGPDTGNATTVIPNTVLVPSDSIAFANPVSVTLNNSAINATAASVPSTSLAVTKALNVSAYKLDMGVLTLAGGAGLYTINANTQYGEVSARSVVDGGVAVTLVSNGPGALILENTAAQLQNAGSSVSITSAPGALGVVLGGAGGSPTGNATVNISGKSLILSSKGGNQSYTPVGTSVTSVLDISARKIGTGVAGTVGTPIRTTLVSGPLAPANATTLTLSTQDNYILSVGAISGGGSVSVPRGTVEVSGALNLTGTGQLTVSKAALSTLAGASAGAITVGDGSLANTGALTSATTLTVSKSTLTSTGAISAPGGTTVTDSTVTASAGTATASLAINNSKYVSTGALSIGGSGIAIVGGNTTQSILELRGGSVSGGAIAAQGAVIHATSGLTIATTTANFTGFNPTGLKGRFILTGGGGQISRGDTQSGILTIETGTNGLVEKVLNQPLNFPNNGTGDATISAFFNGANTGPGFAMGFFGNFTAPFSGSYTLQTGLNDDDAGFWVDLDGDGVFEGGNAGGTPGANGNELIAWASCCGDGANQHPGNVTLVAGQTYKVGIAVEDGQGEAGLVGRITAPGESLKIVDPSAADQTGWWSYGQPNQVIVDVGAELDIRAINGSVNVLVNGHLEFDGAGSSTFNSLTIGNGGIVEVGSGPPSPAGLAEAALPVPEPASLGLIVLGALGCLTGRRRSSRN